MSRILIVGDIHLGKGLTIGKANYGGLYNSRVVDQKTLLDWVLSVVQNKHVNKIILTGDIFEDVKPDYYLINIFIDWLKALCLENVEIYIIAGNHDLKRTGAIYTSALDVISSLDMDNVYICKDITTLIFDNIGITLLPHRDRKGLNCETNNDAVKLIENKVLYECLSIPCIYKKILIGHLSLEGAIYSGEIDDFSNEIICPLNIFNGYDYVWMGHVHKPQIRNDNPHIAHIGSLDISDFSEIDQQKILILYDGKSNSFESINVPSRPLRKLKVGIPQNILGADVTKYLIEQIDVHNDSYPYKNAIVKIEVLFDNPNMPDIDRKLVEEHLYKLGTFNLVNISESKNILVVTDDKKNLMDNGIEVKKAIKIYSNFQTFEKEELQNKFIQVADDIVDECSE